MPHGTLTNSVQMNNLLRTQVPQVTGYMSLYIDHLITH